MAIPQDSGLSQSRPQKLEINLDRTLKIKKHNWNWEDLITFTVESRAQPK